jgi:hypothetical protein
MVYHLNKSVYVNFIIRFENITINAKTLPVSNFSRCNVLPLTLMITSYGRDSKYGILIIFALYPRELAIIPTACSSPKAA